MSCRTMLSFCSLSLQRTAKFVLVGAIGIAVQLGVLEALTTLGCDYMWATGLAIEAAVLNNFMWHERFTWRDRADSRSPQTCVRLVRFHLSNGSISIFGSLLPMRWLVGRLGMSVLVANVLTIAACSVGNFLASDRWVFLSPHADLAGRCRSPIRSRVRWAKGT